jgi:hypothetical protein
MMGIWISGQKLPNYQITQLPNSQRAQASLQREGNNILGKIKPLAYA